MKQCVILFMNMCVCFLRGTPFSFSVRCLRSLAQRADKSEGTQCLKIKVSARVPDSWRHKQRKAMRVLKNLISKILFFWGHNTARLLFHPPANSDSPRSDRIGDVGQSLPIWARDDLISKKIKCCRRSALDIPPRRGRLTYFIARHCYMCCFRSKLLPKSGGHSQETLAVRVWCFVFVKYMYVYRLKFIDT